MTQLPITPRILLSGKITFVERFTPTLQVGRYTARLEQQIEINSSSALVSDASETYSTSQTFYVKGERFALLPEDIKAVFPPDRTEGEHSDVLPHIVLTKKSLPWKWTIENTPQSPDASGSVPTWLAVLVFAANDPPPNPRVRKLSEIQSPEAGVCSYKNLTFQPGETPETPVVTIDIPVDLFTAIAPTAEDLCHLAHARIVEVDKKSTDPENVSGEYSVVIANRLPQSEHTVAHLVCLAGMKDYLPGSGQQIPAGTQYIRLVSLKSWQFIAKEEKADFKDLLEKTVQLDQPNTLLLPSQPISNGTAEDKAIENALKMGYVALNHQSRLGDKTVSWYRGPLIPYGKEKTIALPVPAADALVRYNPETGMFDESYAAAWQLGRLLALQDQEFALALFDWKHNTQIDDIKQAEQEIIEGGLGRSLRSLNGSSTRVGVGNLLNLLAQANTLFDSTSVAGRTTATQPPQPLPTLNFEDLLSRAKRTSFRTTETTPRTELPEKVKTWLGRLRLLHGVPYPYLVPDERMLPPETLRFFQVDLDWINCLTDGAFSIGRSTQGNLEQDRSLLGYFQESAAIAAYQERFRRLKRPIPRAASPSNVVSGFLLHSAVVSHYPGLEVEGYDTEETGNVPSLKLLRFERIAPNVMLCLFNGLVKQVRIHQPPEGLHFGVDVPDSEHSNYTKLLRSLDQDTLGESIPGKRVDVPFRTGNKQVVDIQELATRIKKEFTLPNFTSAELALEMVDGVQQVSFFNK
ncbi:hypothetical protein [Scytonema sp. PCC 10023]|uniref:hypothetical protein n=1 Tax=Scytonema sp. PCC 10023 TaxID=1680591 RepID=UPI0039C631EC